MNNSSSLSYLGKVNIKFLVNNKIISIDSHNTGAPSLFKSLADYLAGNIVSNNQLNNPKLALIPSTLDIRLNENSGVFSESNSSSLLKQSASIPITRTDISNTNELETSVMYESTITYNTLKGDYNSNYDDRVYICLYSNPDNSNVRQMLAYLPFFEEENQYLSYLTRGTQAIVTWTLNISNAS